MEPMIDRIKKFGRCIIEVVGWLWQAKIIWITLLPFVGAYLFIWQTSAGTWDFRFRLAGLVLELLGILTVVIGLIGTRKLFELTHPLGIIREWFKRFPKCEDNNISITGGFFTSTLLSLMNPSPPPPDAPLPDRVTLLEKNLSQTNEWIFKIQEYLTVDLTNESCKRKVGDEKAHQELKKFAVEGIATEMMGLVWLIFGAFSATLSTELVKWLVN